MSPTGRPEGEHRSAQREGSFDHPTGRPEGEHRSAQGEGAPESGASGGSGIGGVPAAIRVAVVDDHTLFRRGVIALLNREPGVEIAGEAADGAEGVKLVLATRPRVVLLDLNMPGISGIETMISILERLPETRVVMLTVSEDSEDLIGALRAGASGYLLKNIDAEYLVASVKRAAAGQSVISAEMTDKLVQGVREGTEASDAAASLSPREREIVALLARGDSNKEIARVLGVAESTVKIHVQHILRKLDLSSRVQVAVWATEHGLAGKG